MRKLCLSGLLAAALAGTAAAESRDEMAMRMQAAEAAANSDARTRAQEFVAANEDKIPIFNGAMFALMLLLLFGNMWIMTKRRPYSRG